MKLLNCLACQDIVKLVAEPRTCLCGRSSGRYENLRRVGFGGPARILGMRSLDYHRVAPGQEYPWFLVPEGPTAVRRDGGT